MIHLSWNGVKATTHNAHCSTTSSIVTEYNSYVCMGKKAPFGSSRSIDLSITGCRNDMSIYLFLRIICQLLQQDLHVVGARVRHPVQKEAIEKWGDDSRMLLIASHFFVVTSPPLLSITFWKGGIDLEVEGCFFFCPLAPNEENRCRWNE